MTQRVNRPHWNVRSRGETEVPQGVVETVKMVIRLISIFFSVCELSHYTNIFKMNLGPNKFGKC